MKALTEFEGLQVENKAGVFIVDNEEKVLRLLTTYGDFSQEFIEKEQTVPFGDCLCGRAAASGELLMSESCFSDSRHERTFFRYDGTWALYCSIKKLRKAGGCLVFIYRHTSLLVSA